MTEVEEKIGIGLYDSATGASLEVIRMEDVSTFQTHYPSAQLFYTEAQAGPIVQLRRGDGDRATDSRIHYFYREPGGQQMIDEDTKRFGFQPGELLALVERYAPSQGAA